MARKAGGLHRPGRLPKFRRFVGFSPQNREKFRPPRPEHSSLRGRGGLFSLAYTAEIRKNINFYFGQFAVNLWYNVGENWTEGAGTWR